MRRGDAIAKILYALGILQIIAGIVLGVMLGNMELGILLGTNGFSWFLFFFSVFNGLFSGIIFIAAGEGLRLLALTANNSKEMEFNVRRIKDKYFEQNDYQT